MKNPEENVNLGESWNSTKLDWRVFIFLKCIYSFILQARWKTICCSWSLVLHTFQEGFWATPLYRSSLNSQFTLFEYFQKKDLIYRNVQQSCISVVWHVGDHLLILLSCYWSPGCLDNGLQLICIFGLVVSYPILTIPHSFSVGFRSGMLPGLSSTVIKKHLVALWACPVLSPAEKRNRHLLKACQQCFKISWYMAALTLD